MVSVQGRCSLRPRPRQSHRIEVSPRPGWVLWQVLVTSGWPIGLFLQFDQEFLYASKPSHYRGKLNHSLTL
ncbi:hypothetical protein BJX70DRAFT_373967 [Aspergillus crustosus]